MTATECRPEIEDRATWSEGEGTGINLQGLDAVSGEIPVKAESGERL